MARRRSRAAPDRDAGVSDPCQYKDKSDRRRAERSEARRADQVGKGPEAPRKSRNAVSAWRPPAVLPKHVRHCHSQGGRSWWIYTWPRSNPGKKVRIPYACGSWRCDGCRRHEAAVAFARIKEAFDPLDPSGFVFLVLTIDRNGFFGGRKWRSADEAFRELGDIAQSLLYRLRSWIARPARRGGLGGVSFKNQWVGVVEAHRSGWPHYNLVIYAPDLARHLRTTAPTRPEGHADSCRCRDCRESILVSGDLRKLVLAAGFGAQSTAEPIHGTKEAVAGYIVKLAGHAEEGAHAFAGEVAKITQVPMNAPERFRRLRSGKGFLPPRRINPEVTGTLVRRQVESNGTVTVMPLHRVPTESVAEIVSCCHIEEEVAHAELRMNAIAKRLGLPLRWGGSHSALQHGQLRWRVL